MKPKIIHFICDLGRGGAENILVQSLASLKDFDNYIVTLSDRNDFGNEINSERIISLNAAGIWRIPLAVFKLRKLIRLLNPSLVHSQLTFTNIIARYGTPKKIPLITTIQNSVKHNIEFKKWFIKWLEKKSLAFRPSLLIFVANSVKQDYYSFLNIKHHQHFILYNFVDTKRFFKKPGYRKPNKVCKIISVGSLSYQKNFEFLITAFLKANISHTELHIYGAGPMKQKIEQLINSHKDKVRLMGVRKNIEEVINDYDLYVSASLYEGLSLSVLEAMATGIPLLLTDIPSYREQCEDVAYYYKLNNETDFITQLQFVLSNLTALESNSQKGINRVEQLFKYENYIQELKRIYIQSIQQNIINNP